MKLNNRFKEEDKIRIWVDHQYCALCRSNEGCSLHHIDGCKKKCHSSILNSIMLCGVCHKDADGHNVSDEEYKAKLSAYSFKWIIPIYKLEEIDREYMESIGDRILNMCI